MQPLADLISWLFSRRLDPAVEPLSKPRSPHWARVRAEHLNNNPFCSACGRTEFLEVHHIEPFHLNPARELDPLNLMTLCDGGGRSCHLTFGHAFAWGRANSTAREDAAYFLAKTKTR